MTSTTDHGRPESFGWLRRKELDTPICEVWEMPDGRLVAHSKSRGPLVLGRVNGLVFREL